MRWFETTSLKAIKIIKRRKLSWTMQESLCVCVFPVLLHQPLFGPFSKRNKAHPITCRRREKRKCVVGLESSWDHVGTNIERARKPGLQIYCCIPRFSINAGHVPQRLIYESTTAALINISCDYLSPRFSERRHIIYTCVSASYGFVLRSWIRRKYVFRFPGGKQNVCVCKNTREALGPFAAFTTIV